MWRLADALTALATATTPPLWAKRPMAQGDFDWVAYCFLSANRRSPAGMAMGAHRDHEAQRRYWVGQERIVHKLLDVCNVTVAEAVGENGVPVLVGFAVWEPGVIHYVLTRRGFQRMGIALDLLANVPSQGVTLYSHQPSIRGLPVPAGWFYDPFQATKHL